jgi:zinc transport system substrate-binding protein
MKIFLYMPVVFLLIFSGCTNKNPVQAGLRVVTSFYPVYIIALNVADGVIGTKVVNMAPPVTGCLHDYSITSEDIKHLEKADLFIVNGAGMESFLDRIEKKSPGLKVAELSKGINLIHENTGDNAHVWVSVSNAVKMTENCRDAFAQADPVNAEIYRKNAGAYVERLDILKNKMKERLDNYRGRKIITFHEAFSYFAKEFGLSVAAVIEREPGSEPSAMELADTIKIIKREKIKLLFAEPQYPSRAADVIAGETGSAVYFLDPAVTGENSKDAYINIMYKNLAVLEKALK